MRGAYSQDNKEMMEASAGVTGDEKWDGDRWEGDSRCSAAKVPERKV